MNGKEFLQQAAQLSTQLVSHRRWLHSHPGTGFDLLPTVQYVKNQLEQLGLTPNLCGRAGITVDISGEKPGKTFLIRADMDALPIAEETELPFSGTEGRMHACGHDLHTAMLLGAAQMLLQNKKHLTGSVRLMFQPAEEIFEGAEDMIAHGVLEGVDAAMMLHVLTGIPLPTGTVIIPDPGAGTPAADYFTIDIRGQGCHGSMPHMGNDPLIPACHLLLGLQSIQTRQLPPGTPVVITVGAFHSGEAHNAIGEKAVLGGTVRTWDDSVRQKVKERMDEITVRTAEAFRTVGSISFGPGCPGLVNDPRLCIRGEEYLTELLGNDRALSAARIKPSAKGSGSEDFAFVSRKVPSVMIALAAGSAEQGYTYPAHHPKTRFDEDALSVGTAVYSWMALRWLSDQG